MDPQDTPSNSVPTSAPFSAGRLAVMKVTTPEPLVPSSDIPYSMPYERPRAPGMHPMVVLQPGEHIVTELKRHPFGIVSVYMTATVGISVAAVLAMILLPGYASGNMTIVDGIFALVVLLIVLVLGLATSVYWQNQWIVTTDSITQISQRTLFDRQVSQLNMENLEDVTVTQEGFLQHAFNYGTLKVETAGERSKFIFPYCPDPSEHARKILEVHEHFLEERHNPQKRA